MGAWIETFCERDNRAHGMSHPTWVRGLKLRAATCFDFEVDVAPYVGAWIETILSKMII